MIILAPKDIDIILNEYSQKVYNKEPGITKIPYQSWRDLKALASSNLICHIKTSNNNLLYLDRADGLYKSIPVTESFIKVFKERTIHMVDTNSNISAPMPNKSDSVSRKGFNMNFDFGPCGDEVAFSPYGLAIRNSKGEYFTYNPATKQTIDVTGFTFFFQNMVYRMPVAASAVKEGDMIIHKHHPMFVSAVDGNNIEVVDILESEVKTVIPTSNPFGFNFITKIMPIVNFGNTAPSPDQPFGNLMPMMMANMIFGEDGNNSDMGKMFMLSAMMGNSNPFSFLAGGEVGSASK